MFDATPTAAAGTIGRQLARELTADEIAAIAGADGTHTVNCSVPIEPEDCDEDLDCE